MKNDLIFKTKLIFDSVTYYEETESWCFFFSDKTNVSIAGFWRIFKSNKIIFVSTDNGHQFGLPEPLDLVSEITKELSSKVLIEIKADKDTADLTLTLTDEIRIESYTSSTGYESFYLAINGETYIGMGGGSVEVVVPTEDPQRLQSKTLR